MLLDIVTKGSADRSLVLRMADSSDGTPETGVTSATSGLDIWYRREGGLKVSLTEADLTALDDAHSDGGLLHISDGDYRVDFPDAAFATGANYVDVGWGATDMVGFGGRVRLVDFDLETATQDVILADGEDHGGSTATLELGSSSGPSLMIKSSASLSEAALIENTQFGSTALLINGGSNGIGLNIGGTPALGSTLASAIEQEAADALDTYDPPTKAELDAAFAEIKGATWDSGTDTLEAIRERGDSAWITATGFSTHSAEDVVIAMGSGTFLTGIPWNADWDTEVQSEVVDALQETVPDSVPADGSRPNMQQAAYMILQTLTDFAISGTTLTVRKPDGSTTLFALELDDDTSPTSATRSS